MTNPLRPLGRQPFVMPLPAVLIATYGPDERPNAMTAAWASSCCHDPPCVGVAVRDSRLTYRHILDREAFTVCVPSTAQAAAVDYLGLVSGKREPDKLAKVGLEALPAPTANAPLLPACPVNVECKLHSQLAIGTHTWFVGEVLEVHVHEACFDDEGKLDADRIDPLVYATSVRQYRGLGGVVAQAFSVGKTLR